jgi:uncharacterized caspase-like protein
VHDKHYAVVIGLNGYSNGIPKLKGAANDAARFHEWLIAQDERGGRLNPDNVSAFIDGESEKVDYITIKNKLSDVIAYDCIRNNENSLRDRLYIYMAGHGFTAEDTGYLLSDLTAFLPLESRSVDFSPHFWVYNISSMSSKIGFYKEVILIMDCCRNEAGTNGIAPFWIDTMRNDLLNSNAYPYIHTLFATQPQLKTREFEIRPGEYAGVFTDSLLRGLRGAVDVNGKITLNNVIEQVHNDYRMKKQPPPQFSNTDHQQLVFSEQGETLKSTLVLHYNDFDGTFSYIKIITPSNQEGVIHIQMAPSSINLDELEPGQYTLKLYSSDDELNHTTSVSLTAGEMREITFSEEAASD